jgi:glutamate N-acetyltransferase/amino-acid N-acetyltransferase
MTTVSPLAPERFPDLPPVGGVRLAAVEAGLRYQRRADLMLAALDRGTTAAGVFTRSRCPSAPVDWCRSVIGAGGARAVICNAGNANAFTGRAGDTAARHTAEAIAMTIGCEPEEVLLASTGVIGETLDEAALVDALPVLVSSEPVGWEAAAAAIRTTDTHSKGSGRAVAGSDANVVGIAKGSGMIAPDMATMLGFVFTDLAVTAPALQAALSASVAASYNRITVDSDTSTSDTVLLLATGAAGNQPIAGPESPGWPAFVDALDQVNLDLAHQIVRDGEGATKFVEVRVTGAESPIDARKVGLSIANSPLVKTAIAGEDPNWGRIVMAVGKSGAAADRDRLTIRLGDILVAEAGWVAPSYRELDGAAYMKNSELVIGVHLGMGRGTATIWTCDLTHRYIEINADYRS